MAHWAGITLWMMWVAVALSVNFAQAADIRPQALDEEITTALSETVSTGDANASVLESEFGKATKPTAAVEIETSAVAKDAKSEADIPVFTKQSNGKSTTDSALFRLLLSLGIVGVAGIGIFFFAKWWTRSHKANELGQQIRVMTQHHLGPRKSLAIVRVAGEYILLGVTDHNISMIKTLALIDDEVPDVQTSRFVDALNKHELDVTSNASADLKQEEFSFGNIKELVSNRLSQMRSID